MNDGADPFLALQSVRDGELQYPYNTSHGAEGSNALSYDGAARWVSRGEVKAGGFSGEDPNHPDIAAGGYMRNYRPSGNFYKFVREYAEP
jgi:hypothetical protein